MGFDGTSLVHGPPRLPSWILPFLLFAGSLAYYFSYYDQGLILNDEGHLVHFSERCMNGQVPGRDFHLETYIYGRYALLAFLFHIFGGPHLLIERAMWVVLRSMCVLMQFFIARRFMPTTYALVPSLFLMVLPGPWHKTPYPFCSLLGLGAILLILDFPSFLRIAWGAVASGLCIQMRQDVGLVIVATMTLGLLFCSDDKPGFGIRFSKALNRWLFYFSILLLTLLPACCILYMNEALGAVFRQCFIEKFSQHLGLFDFVPRLKRMWETGDHLSVVYFLAPIPLFMSTAFLLGYRFLRNKADGDLPRLTALFLVSLLTINQAYNHALVIRLLQSSAPTYILGSYLLWSLAREVMPRFGLRTRTARAWIIGGVPALAGTLLILVSLEIMTSKREANLGVEYRGSIATYGKRNEAINSFRAGVYVEPHKARLVNAILAFLGNHTIPGEPIYMASNDAMIYFLANRPNPSRFAKFIMPGEAPGRAERVAQELSLHTVKYVITTTRLWHERKDHPAIMYLKRNYFLVKKIDTRYQKTYMILERRRQGQ